MQTRRSLAYQVGPFCCGLQPPAVPLVHLPQAFEVAPFLTWRFFSCSLNKKDELQARKIKSATKSSPTLSPVFICGPKFAQSRMHANNTLPQPHSDNKRSQFILILPNASVHQSTHRLCPVAHGEHRDKEMEGRRQHPASLSLLFALRAHASHVRSRSSRAFAPLTS